MTTANPYGTVCPTCGAPTASRTRGIPSYDRCANGHKYLASEGVVLPEATVEAAPEAMDYTLARMPYAVFVSMLCKDGAAIKEALTPEQAHILHMGVGVAGEGGELLDAIKRWTIYQKPLDRENVIEELGDLKFFITEIMTRLEISDVEVEQANKAKLAKRYKSLAYTDQQAQDRADKIVD
jgi:NTP pyrophosphatase (non-canonical NTP hydrolase)